MDGAKGEDEAQRDPRWQSPLATDCIALVRREALTAAQRDAVRALVAPRVSEFDDLLRDWDGSLSTIEVFWNRTREEPVGLISWSGWREVTAAWWIAHRGHGFGRRAAELLARVFVEHGAQIISPLPILQSHRLASARMAKHLRRAFAAAQRKVL